MNSLSLSANPSLEMLCSQYWLNWLEEQNLSIALTTYQSNRLFLIGLKPDNSLSTFERLFERAMGLYATEDGLLLATRYQIWQLDNLLSPGKLHQGSYDRLYTPTIGYTTGDINTHELAIDRSGEIIFVNTKYSCLAKLKRKYSFDPVWQPSFISDLVAEDRCHLNGMVMVEGKPKYVTACSRSDVPAGWRLRRDGGGVVIDVESKEIIASGLSMPHSPRWYRDKLWLNNSGTGEFGCIDLDTGKFEPVVFCPGFVRGLAFHNEYAIVGMSKPRDHHFSGLPLDDKLAQKDAIARCGVMVIDLNKGKIAHWIELEGVVKELFDVAVLPGVRQPMALGFKTDEIERLIVFPGKGSLPPLKEETEKVEVKATSTTTLKESKPLAQADKTEIQFYFNRGRQQKKEGNLSEAIAAFKRVIQFQPDNFAAYNNLGNIFQSQGETDKAIACWQKAALIKPDNAFIFNNLGQIWQLEAKPELALEAYKKAIAVKPDFALAYLNLGKLLHQKGAIKRAEQCYQRVLELEPNNSEAHFSYGNLLKDQERLEEAIAAYRLAVKYQPDFTAAYLNLGGVLRMRRANEIAKKCYQKVLKLEPDNQIATSNLGILLQAEGNLEAARQAYEAALKLNPEDNLSFYRLAYLRRKLCDWDNYEQLKAELIERTQKHLVTADSAQLLPLILNFFDLDLELHQALASHYAHTVERQVTPIKSKLAFTRDRVFEENSINIERRKLRVGYVSADFRNHPVGCLIQDLFSYHDRNRFEVYCYSLINTEDEITTKIKDSCDRYTEIALMSTQDAAQRISNDNIDILIDLTGYTTYCRSEIFALQPAPVQCQYLGFPDTMGADFIQYIIADEQLIAPQMATHFSEEVMYLPHALVSSSMAISDREMNREEFNLPADRFVFCCFNRPEKISPQVFSVWMDILQQAPNAVLWLYAGDNIQAETNLKEQAKKADIEPDRLIFAGKLPHAEYLARYRLADLFLDTFNYNAGATAISAWQAGLPVLTLAGNSFAGRMGASVASAVGKSQFICQTVEEYQQKAVYWATHSGKLKILRQELINNQKDLPLFNLAEFVSNLESAYQQMWQQMGVGDLKYDA